MKDNNSFTDTLRLFHNNHFPYFSELHPQNDEPSHNDTPYSSSGYAFYDMDIVVIIRINIIT